MALDLKKLNFFSKLDARARVFVLFGGIIGLFVLIYLGSKLISGDSGATGPSRVASAPVGLQSVPGGQTSPEYERALAQANAQYARQAQMSGGSAVPTMINYSGQQMQGATGNCNIICSDQSANVKTNLDDWVRQGKVAPEIATMLEQLADKNVPVDEYAAALDRLVKEGKLTPEQARELLEQYKKQHMNAMLQESAAVMDKMIKSGQLPLEVANQLLTAQKNKINPSEYATSLQDLVKQGKLTPAAASQLLAQYTKQRQAEVIKESLLFMHQLMQAGQITADVEKELAELDKRMVPTDMYAATLQRLVTAGKLIPASADRLLEDFKREKAAVGPTETIDDLIKKAEAAAFDEIDQLKKIGKMTKEVGDLLTDMINRNVSLTDFQTMLNQLVQQGKMTPDIAKLKYADYQLIKGLRDEAARLGSLQGNNANSSAYADELRRAVQAGVFTPEQAAQIMQEYQSISAPNQAQAQAEPIPGADDFAKLQQRLQEAGAGGGAAAAAVTPNEFASAQTAAIQETTVDRQSRIDALANAMGSQAQSLLSAWKAPTMFHRGGVEDAGKTTKSTTTKSTSESASSGGKAEGAAAGYGEPPLIKAGTILFGVLDTSVNSDYPDSPVMVTIVSGKYKGAKLLGKLQTAKTPAGQMDRVALNFTLMNMDDWIKSKSVTASAIDPDTARTVMASTVDYHYMQKYGAVMATSFLQGYANALTTSGTTQTASAFGVTSTNAALSPGQKFMAALGQIGQNLGTVTQGYTTIPPTVRVDSGVSLGILFMSDVS